MKAAALRLAVALLLYVAGLAGALALALLGQWGKAAATCVLCIGLANIIRPSNAQLERLQQENTNN